MSFIRIQDIPTKAAALFSAGGEDRFLIYDPVAGAARVLPNSALTQAIDDRIASQGLQGGAYLGVYDASGDVAPAAGTNPGDWYFISAGGTFNAETYAINDITKWDGSAWEKVSWSQSGGFTNVSTLVNTDPAIFADGDSGEVDPLGESGWYYKNGGNKKINWYFFGGYTASPANSLGQLKGVAVVVDFKVATSEPAIIVYTTPEKDGSDIASWYRTRKVFAMDAPAAVTGKYLVHTAGFDVSGIEPALPRLVLPVSNPSSLGPAAPGEVLSLMSFSTPSGQAAGTMEFVASKIVYEIGTTFQTFNLVALPQVVGTANFGGSFPSASDFPEQGDNGSWVIAEDVDEVHIWDTNGGGWTSVGTSAPTDADFEFTHHYDPALNNHGYGYAEGDGNFSHDLEGNLLPLVATETSDNRILVGRITEPGDSVFITGISPFTAGRNEFALVAWMEATAPTWRTGVSSASDGTTAGDGWVTDAPGSRDHLWVTGGSRRKWDLRGTEVNWVKFTQDVLYHSNNKYPIDTEVRFRLCETGNVQLYLNGDFIAESDTQITPNVGAEIWLLAPEGRVFPQPGGGLNSPPEGAQSAPAVQPNFWISDTDPAGDVIQLLASGEGKYLYSRGQPKTPGDQVLSRDEAEAARGCRPFNSFVGLSPDQRLDIIGPVIEEDRRFLDRLREESSAWFASLGLTADEELEREELYADVFQAFSEGWVSRCLAALQDLDTNSIPTSGVDLFVPTQVSTGGSSLRAEADFGPGDSIFDTYGVRVMVIGEDFISLEFDKRSDYNRFLATGADIVLNDTTGAPSWEGAQALSGASIILEESRDRRLTYRPTTLSAGELVALATHVTSAGVGSGVLEVTLTALATSPADVYTETELVNYLIAQCETHLTKFPR